MAKEMERESRVRWTEAEWCSTLAAALPLVASEGLTLERAIVNTQAQVLPRARIRKYAVIHQAIIRGTHKPALLLVQQAKGDAPAQSREAVALPVVDAAKLKNMPGRTVEEKARRASYTGGFHWTAYEWALIAREITRMRRAKDLPRRILASDVRCILEAQDRCLPVGRRRSIYGIQKDWYDKAGHSKAHFADAQENLGRVLSQPVPEVLSVAIAQAKAREREAARAAERAAAAAQAVAAFGAATATTPDSVASESAPVAAAAVAQTPSTAATVPSTPAASADPNAGRDDVPRVSPAALKFATQMAYAVDTLLNEQASAVAQAVGNMIDARITALTDALVANVAQRVGADIQSNLARVVHLLMESELGPVKAPPLAEPVQQVNGHEPPPEAGPARPPRLSVDVVGLSGDPVRIVADAFREQSHIDIRFLEPRQAKTTEYRSTVVAVTKFLSHSALARMKRQGVNVVQVQGAAQSVIAAMRMMAAASAASDSALAH